MERSATYINITISPSAFLTQYEAPSLSMCSQNRKVAYIEDLNVRISQRVVAAPAYCRSNVQKLDSVMVEDGRSNHSNSAEIGIPVWFGQALDLLKICKAARLTQGSSRCISCNIEDCKTVIPSVIGEYCFYSITISKAKWTYQLMVWIEHWIFYVCSGLG